MIIILILEITAAAVVLALFRMVREVALEHTFMTLRKNYRGYNEPDDYSEQWNLVMEKVREVALEHTFMTLRKNYRGYNEPDDYSEQWNLVMEKLKCCGVNNYTDFSGSSFEMTTGHTYPRGCCISIGAAACDGHTVSKDVIHQKGCFHKLLKITQTQSFTLSGFSLGAAVIQDQRGFNLAQTDLQPHVNFCLGRFPLLHDSSLGWFRGLQQDLSVSFLSIPVAGNPCHPAALHQAGLTPNHGEDRKRGPAWLLEIGTHFYFSVALTAFGSKTDNKEFRKPPSIPTLLLSAVSHTS
ncbi:Hypothetical predicted protein [Marmota monax]|uniref:Tetraspanin n=1 Tax=Marmota monax TaxID=9995 RepID=A0A5E4ABL4_MARMO|nr:Hypothetical predicted protein [Marmota monax]